MEGLPPRTALASTVGRTTRDRTRPNREEFLVLDRQRVLVSLLLFRLLSPKVCTSFLPKFALRYIRIEILFSTATILMRLDQIFLDWLFHLPRVNSLGLGS